MNEYQHDDTSDTGDLRDDADEKTDTDRDVAELLQLSRGSPPDMIRSNIFSFQRFAKCCILITATTVDPMTLYNMGKNYFKRYQIVWIYNYIEAMQRF